MGIYCSFDPKITFRVDSETSYLQAFLKSVIMFYRALVILSNKRKQNFSKFWHKKFTFNFWWFEIIQKHHIASVLRNRCSSKEHSRQSLFSKVAVLYSGTGDTGTGVFKSTFFIKTSVRQPLNNTYSALRRTSEFTLVLLQTKDSLSHSIFIAKETLFF